MATGKIVLDEGSTTNTATYSGTEDAVTKHVGRVVLNHSDLSEVASGSPLEVNLRSSTVGVATAAKQPALGTAGTASSDVISIQGIASMTKLLVTPDSVALPANQSVNEAQINGVTPLMGNGTTGTGSQRVTIASDNTAFSVNANAGTNLNTSALALESGGNLAAIAADTADVDAALDASVIAQEATTSGAKGITAFGAVTTSAPTYTTAKSDALSLTTGGALRSDITTIAGTAPSAAGKIDVKAADGDVFVRQATAGNLNATVIGAGSAGTANAGVVTVQGIASMTKLLVTPDSVALPANQTINAAQLNGHTTLEGGTNGSLAIGGTVATNVAITANPLNLGAQAVSSENTAVTTARQVQLIADLVGKLIVLPFANPENFVNGTTAALTDTTSTSLIASAGGSLRNYVTDLTVTNSHATVGTFVKILDGATIIWEGYAASAGGGFAKSFSVPLRGTAATAVNAQCVTTGANVIVSASGYKGV